MARARIENRPRFPSPRPATHHPPPAVPEEWSGLRLAAGTGWAIALFLGLAALGVPQASAQVPDAEDGIDPGLIARFYSTGSATGPTVVERVDPNLSQDWGSGGPDSRVPAEGFAAHWSGVLLIQSPGAHRFFVRTDGAVELTVAGKRVATRYGGQVEAQAVELPAGLAPLELRYRHSRGPARLAVAWEGPGFVREPLPARLLFHERQGAAGKEGPQVERFEEGRQLADRLGCANCHTILDLPSHPNLGPPLDDAGLAIAPAWLATWLTDPAALRPATRMPALGAGAGRAEVADLIAWLRQTAPRGLAPSNELQMALNVADPARGRLLFRSLGCLGCHTRGGALASTPNRVAPDLSDLGHKRAQTWIAEFLEKPRNRPKGRHRPDLRLTADEAAHLAAYLMTDEPGSLPPPLPIPAPAEPAGDPARGRAFAEQRRCAACHAIDGLKPAGTPIPLLAGSNPQGGCLAPAPVAGVPRFSLSEPQKSALRIFVAGLPARPSPTAQSTFAQDTIRRLGCLGCHIRDGQGGIFLGAQVAEALAADASLGSLKGTLTPPNLSAVGDKLRAEYLLLAVRGQAPTARPWLAVRMPVFPFAPGEAEAIVRFFQNSDRLDPDAAAADSPEVPTHPSARTLEAASTLIGQRGFGCLSCHVLAGKVPPGGEPETLGPDLALAPRRMTAQYFHRWVANPQRILPGTPMPQFLQHVPMQPGTLDDQLEAIWQLLGSGRVSEFAAFGTRELLSQQGQRAAVVRDMVVFPKAPVSPYTPRGLAIGLEGGHSALFDTDRLAWLAWWHGSFLSRTKSGRLWEWHPAGTLIATAPERSAPVVFVDASGAATLPSEVRERFGSFNELIFEERGVRLSYTLQGPGGVSVRVEERIEPIESGWERRVRVLGVPTGYRPALAERPPAGSELDQAKSAFTWAVGARQARLALVEPSRAERTAFQAPWPLVRLFPMAPVEPGTFEARIQMTLK
jgi:mono/diheme cytochrome c family protein